MRQKQNAEHSTDSESASDKDSTVEVSLRWIHSQISRVLEVFIILQFVTGAFIFFTGIFLLLWAVTPSTSLQAGSYMLLAFFINFRALLGLFGNSSDNFCLLASYGVLHVATFVIRTILTLVRLKITTGADEQLAIPPLLQAMPGALNAPIELICSLLECSQAICSFYICWIITKTASIEKSVEESRLNIATEIARYLSQQESSKRTEEANKEKSSTIKSNQNKTESLERDGKHPGTDGKETTLLTNSVQALGAKTSKGQSVPLKSILHHPSVHSEQHKALSQQQETDNVDHFAQYRKYPHKISNNRPSRPTHLPYQNHSAKEYQCNGEVDGGQSRPQSDENLDQLVQDFNNNNSDNAPVTMTNEGGEQYNNAANNFAGSNEHHYGHYAEERGDRLHWDPPVPVPPFPPLQSHLPAMHLQALDKPFIDHPPEYMNAGAMHTVAYDMVNHRHDQLARTVSPTPPSEMNLSSPNSPLLYDHRMAVYQDYGSTNGTMHYPQPQQFQMGPPMHYPAMYR